MLPAVPTKHARGEADGSRDIGTDAVVSRGKSSERNGSTKAQYFRLRFLLCGTEAMIHLL
jgi:hypothetical protein